MQKRGKPLLDDLDLIILETIKEGKFGIMKLTDKIGINHNNLKPHITKLHRLGVIKKTPVFLSRKITLSTTKKTGAIIKLLKKIRKLRRGT